MSKRTITLNKLAISGAKKSGFFRKLFRFCLFMVLFCGTAGCLVVMGVYTYYSQQIPPLTTVQSYQPRVGSSIYSVDNQLIGEFAEERRVLVPYDRIPIRVVQAFIAAEDKRFFSHHGVDYIGMINAVTQKLRNPKAKLRGASTITQQFAKSLLIEEEGFDEGTARKVGRKIKELILARRMEQSMSKEDIMYLYLNQIYFGHRAYGIQAAAQNYFHKNVWDLSLAEISTFAGLPQSPSAYSPYRHPKRAKDRRQYVLKRMLEEGFISQEEFAQAKDEDLVVYGLEDPFLERAPYFTETVRQEVIKMFADVDLCEEIIRDVRDKGWCRRLSRQCREGVIIDPETNVEKKNGKGTIEEQREKCATVRSDELAAYSEEKCEPVACKETINDKCSKWSNQKYCFDYYKNTCDTPERCKKILYTDPAEERYTRCMKKVDNDLMVCEEEMGAKALLEGGLRIYTTMVPAKQAAGQRSLYDTLLSLDKRQGYRGPLSDLWDPEQSGYKQGPLPKAQWASFTKEVAAGMPAKYEDLEPGQRYLAVVTGFDSERHDTFIQVGNIEGLMPLAAMRWARTPNPVVYYQDAYLKDPQQALKVGDVILVTPTNFKALSQNRFAWDQEVLRLVKVKPDKPMFALEQDPIAQGSILGIDARSGYVEGMVGGFDFKDSPLNRPMQACRQPGSSFKPVIYSAAVDKLDFTPSTILIDSPVYQVDDLNGNVWTPENSDVNYKGDTPVRTCIKDSMNICAVKTLEQLFNVKKGGIGSAGVVEYAKKLGIDTDARPINRDLSIALGSSCVTMWDLINVYATFNRGGLEREKYIIKRIEFRDGRVFYDHTASFDPTSTFGEQLNRAYAAVATKPRRIMDQPTAFIMTSMLHNVIMEGTGTTVKHRLKTPDGESIYASGKTGTTNDSFDAWFMGYTQDYVTGTWVGHDKNERPLGPKEFGGSTPLPMWVDYMKTALKDIPQNEPEPPVGVTEVRIDPENGLLASPETHNAVREWYRTGTEPTQMSMRNMGYADGDIYSDDDE